MELKDQLLLEEDLILQGVDRYMSTTNSAQEKGRGADTGYGQRLLTTLITPVAESITEFCEGGAGKHGKYKKLIKDMDHKVLAYIVLKVVLNKLHQPRTITQIALEVGLCVEDELRFAAFKEVNPQYYDTIINDFKKKNTKAYRHMRNVLAVSSRKKGFKWDSWSKDFRLQVGTILIDQVVKATDLVKINKKKLKSNKWSFSLYPTPEAIEWVEKYNEYASLLHPYTKPCIIPPDDWTGVNDGGYWSEAMRQRTPFVKGLSGYAEKFVSDHDLSIPFEAVNAIQRTPWTVNTDVLDVLSEIWDRNLAVGIPKKEPIEIPVFKDARKPADMDKETFQEFLEWKVEVSGLYTKEVSRSSRAFEVARVISMARSYSKYDSIWFVHQCDFRGRVYASSAGLNPQGTDFNRALLKFRHGKVLGESGVYWLAVHGANCYGVDKVSFEDRIDWVLQNMEYIERTKQDPLGMIDFWGSADSPYMFLAFCLEFAEGAYSPDTFVSHIPVGMDGSCNGLQHFSALLRDKRGGEATNLVPSTQPTDIYNEVAVRASEEIKTAIHSDSRTQVLSFIDKHGGLPRKIAKRPVMTVPYSSTKYACFGFVEDAIKEIDPDYFENLNSAASFINDHIWEAIGEVVVSARDAMGWLQDITKALADRNLPVWWINPAGFPVYQDIKKTVSKPIRTALMGGTSLRLSSTGNDISPAKQTQGVAPNFVHSMDSAHMMLTVMNAMENGVNTFSMIHDDYGTHAADVELFREVIKTTFVDMYKGNDPLLDLLNTVALSIPDCDIPPLPDTGELDLDLVLDSDYFFA